jgi:hypothetical protein
MHHVTPAPSIPLEGAGFEGQIGNILAKEEDIPNLGDCLAIGLGPNLKGKVEKASGSLQVMPHGITSV